MAPVSIVVHELRVGGVAVDGVVGLGGPRDRHRCRVDDVAEPPRPGRVVDAVAVGVDCDLAAAHPGLVLSADPADHLANVVVALDPEIQRDRTAVARDAHGIPIDRRAAVGVDEGKDFTRVYDAVVVEVVPGENVALPGRRQVRAAVGQDVAVRDAVQPAARRPEIFYVLYVLGGPGAEAVEHRPVAGPAVARGLIVVDDYSGIGALHTTVSVGILQHFGVVVHEHRVHLAGPRDLGSVQPVHGRPEGGLVQRTLAAAR